MGVKMRRWSVIVVIECHCGAKRFFPLPGSKEFKVFILGCLLLEITTDDAIGYEQPLYSVFDNESFVKFVQPFPLVALLLEIDVQLKPACQRASSEQV